MGVHGVIEFGNRHAHGRARGRRHRRRSCSSCASRARDLSGLTLGIGLGIIVQAVIGGIIVLLASRPSWSGVHFLISLVLVALATVLVVRVYAVTGPRVPRRAPDGTRRVPCDRAVVARHRRDRHPAHGLRSARRGSTPRPQRTRPRILWSTSTPGPAYVTFALTLVLFAGSFAVPRRAAAAPAVRPVPARDRAGPDRRWACGRRDTGLPDILVGIHMVLAVLVVAAMTASMMALTAPARRCGRRSPSRARRLGALGHRKHTDSTPARSAERSHWRGCRGRIVPALSAKTHEHPSQPASQHRRSGVLVVARTRQRSRSSPWTAGSKASPP